jgi:predicted CoA-binding protein
MDTDHHTDEEIKKFYNLKNIAVVGMSKNEEKPSHFVPRYLVKNGYSIILVNPRNEVILEIKSYNHV